MSDQHVDVLDIRRLHDAAKAGDADLVRRIVQRRPELARECVSDTDEHQAIHYAARGGHVEVVRALLEAGADPLEGIYPNRRDTTARHLADVRGHREIVAFIDRHLAATRNASDAGTAFTDLVDRGDAAAVAAALDAEPALIGAADARGESPLHRAARGGHAAIARLLLDRGADVDARSPAGFRPIHHALYRNYASWPDPAVARLLVERGAAVDAWVAAAMGDEPSLAALLARDRAAAGRAIDVAPWSDGIYPATTVFPLSIAALHAGRVGHDRIVELLLDHRADPDAALERAYGPASAFRESGLPLQFAAGKNDLSTARLLLDRGASPNTSIMAGGWALSHAVENGHGEMVELLRSRGATAAPYVMIKAGWDDEAITAAARDPAAAREVVWTAVQEARPDLVRRALPLVRDLKPIDWFQLMWQACRPPLKGGDLHRLLEAFELLLAAVPDVNVWKHDGGGMLHRVADDYSRKLPPEQRVGLASLLLDRGADVNAIEVDYQSTPLGYAARNGYGELVELYLKRGADPTRAGAPWATPLAWAERAGHAEIAAMLRAAGATA